MLKRGHYSLNVEHGCAPRAICQCIYRGAHRVTATRLVQHRLHITGMNILVSRSRVESIPPSRGKHPVCPFSRRPSTAPSPARPRQGCVARPKGVPARSRHHRRAASAGGSSGASCEQRCRGVAKRARCGAPGARHARRGCDARGRAREREGRAARRRPRSGRRGARIFATSPRARGATGRLLASRARPRRHAGSNLRARAQGR